MLIIAIIILQLVAIGIIVGTSKVQDVTLATDDVVECNEGWRITTEDGLYAFYQQIKDCRYLWKTN